VILPKLENKLHKLPKNNSSKKEQIKFIIVRASKMKMQKVDMALELYFLE
jgi:hypothetical protein